MDYYTNCNSLDIQYTLYYQYTFRIGDSFQKAQFADDSAIIITAKSSNKIIKSMKKVIHSSKIYFHKWKIKINESKTDAIIFPFNKSPKRDPTLELSLGNTILPIKPVVKYLGIMLDSKLLFKQHIAMICDKAVKCGRALFPLLNRKSVLNYKNKMLLYKACIRSILTYGCSIFRKCAKSHLKRLQVIQNKMLKLIYNLNIRHSTERLQKTIMEIRSDFTRSFNERCRRSDYAHVRQLIT